MQAQAIRVHPDDNIIVALQDLEAGENVSVGERDYTVKEYIPHKHKFAAHDFSAGDQLIMYGVCVGEAQTAIPQGCAINTKNVKHASAAFTNERQAFSWQAPEHSAWDGATFDGYLRANGDVGTANYWLVVPLVFCENRNIDCMRDAMLEALGYGHSDPYKQYVADLLQARQQEQPLDQVTLHTQDNGRHPIFPHVDGVQFIRHTMGCGGDRGDAQTFCGLLAGYICHPNVAGATILSLGCQNAQVQLLEEEIAKRQAPLQKPLLVFEQQRYGTEQAMLKDAIRMTIEGLEEANTCRRSPQPLSALRIGVECGASDGFSGISANPSIGQCIDLLVSIGGSGILSEFPELCGVEADIIRRCVDQDCADRFVALIRAYEQHAAQVGVHFDTNPSPGNIRDGLITDAMKSAGAAKKGGTAPVVQVLDYPEPVTEHGLHLLNTPGNDVESCTALVGAGAHMILFSTGLGTPTGNPIAPVIKVSSNSTVAERMHDIIDFNCGGIISGDDNIETLGNDLLRLCQQTASGSYICKAQQLGQFDFQAWKRGVSL